MLFHTFNSQEKRIEYGGSAFIEMQFCVLPAGTTITNIVAIDRIQHWRNDSLYIYIDYYAPKHIDPIIEKVYKEKLMDYEIMVDWLNDAKEYNGFYILGI